MPHPDHLLTVLTHRQLAEWSDFAEIEPWGGPADDYRAGLVAWAASSVLGGGRRNTPADFVPKWGPADPLTEDQLKAKLRSVLANAVPRS